MLLSILIISYLLFVLIGFWLYTAHLVVTVLSSITFGFLLGPLGISTTIRDSRRSQTLKES